MHTEDPDPAHAQDRREKCRRKVLGFLAERAQVAHHANTIRNRLNVGHQNDYSTAEIEAACALLCGLAPEPLAKAVRDPLGASVYYQATSAGVITHERL
jgi:hypothetical protein